MQVEIQCLCLDDKPISFDHHYPLHAMWMQSLSASHSPLAKELHDGIHKGRVKLIGHSPLNGGKAIAVEGQKRKQLQLGKRTWFRIASPIPEFLNAIGESLLMKGEFELMGKKFRITGVNMVMPPQFKEKMVWRPFGSSTSIVTAWSPKGGKKRYLRPDHQEGGYPSVEKLIEDNLTLKFNKRLMEIRPDIAEAWLKDSSIDAVVRDKTEISVKLLQNKEGRPYQKKTTKIKNIDVYSWRCPIEIEAPIAVQRLIYSCGLGGLNSQGFGLMQEGKDVN